MTRVLLIANPRAGRFRGEAAAKAAAARLEAAGLVTRVLLTRGPGDATELARTESPDFDWVVAVGGDGTLVEVVRGLDPERRQAVGLVPMGTANVIARELGLPRSSPERAAETLLRGRSLDLDWGQANGRPFVANVGAGFDARVVHDLTARRRATSGHIGMAGYLPVGIAALRRYRTPSLSVAVDGGPLLGPFSTVTVTNAANYGGLLSLCPEARVDDRRLDCFGGRAKGRLGIVRHLAAALLRCKDAARTLRATGRRFRIESSAEPEAVQIDGDPAGFTPVEVCLADRPLRFIVPGGRGPEGGSP